MTKELPTVSIIVVNYNGKKFLEGFFNSVLNLDYPKHRYEIIFVDNGSTDGSPEYVQRKLSEHVSGKRHPMIRIVKLHRNLGFAAANNIAALLARGKYLAFINNDVVVGKKWLRRLVDCMSEEGGEGIICGSKMLWYYNPLVIIYNGGYMTIFGVALHEDLYRTVFDKQTNNIRHETFYADGCGFIISRNDFLKLGGFNVSHFAYAEDYELSWRAWLSGMKVLVEPSAYFWHKVSGTLGEQSPLKTYLLWKNLIYNLFELAHPLLLPIMIILNLAYGFAYNCLLGFLRGNLWATKGQCRAYLRVLREISRTSKNARARRALLLKRYGREFLVANSALVKSDKILGVLASIKHFVEAELRRRVIR